MSSANQRLTEVTCPDGHFLVDEQLVRSIIESRYRAMSNLEFGKAVPQDTAWWEPDVKVYEVDWEKARGWTESQTRAKLYSTWLVSGPAMEPRIRELIGMRKETLAYRDQFRENIRQTMRESMASIDRTVEKWGDWAAGARFTRDLSAGVLMVGATVMTAGAGAVAAGGTGTAIRFTAKLQDGVGDWRRNVGAALVQSTGDLIFTIVPATRAGQVLRGAKGSTKAAFVFLQAKFDTLTSLAEGKSVSDALLDGAMGLAFEGGSRIPFARQHLDAIKGSMAKWTMPMTFKVIGDKRGATQAAKALSRGAASFAASRFKGAATSATSSMFSSDERSVSSSILQKSLTNTPRDHAVIVADDLVSRAVKRL